MFDKRTRAYLADVLADAFLAGTWTERAMADRAGQLLRPAPRWRHELARWVLTLFPRPPLNRRRQLARQIDGWLAGPPGQDGDEDVPRVQRVYLAPSAMGPARWPVPLVDTVGELAEWLGLGLGELEWFADLRGLERTVAADRLRHYRYVTHARTGGRVRMIEAPKPRLKAIQRRLLDELLMLIPVHPAAHGFVPGRSVHSHAARHTGQAIVVRFDLEDFFASVTARHIYGIFLEAGYPESVAHTLTGLMTNVVPARVWAGVAPPTDRLPDGTRPVIATGAIAAHHRLGRRLAAPHLPQGAPTSPALANLAAFRLDRRLDALAGLLKVTYTRYADDLTFSGGTHLRGAPRWLAETVDQIARYEGFRLNPAKTRLVTGAGRQTVTGIVVNRRLNVRRGEYDRLRAILHNAARTGPAAQNHGGHPDFRAHLLGRIAWVASLNPARGERLRRAFDVIEW